MGSDGVDRRQKVLDTALKLFIERGIDKTPTSLIAKEAGVATGTLFHYFKDKEALVNSLFLEVKKNLAEEVLSGLKETSSDLDLLKNWWTSLVKWGIENPMHFRLMKQISNYPGITDHTRDIGASQFEFLRKAYRNAVKKGVLKKVDEEFVKLFYLNSVQTAIEHFHQFPKQKSLANLDTMFDLFLNGLSLT